MIFDINFILILVFFTVLWLIFWSFANALVRRIHEWKKISEWRSECPKCKNQLKFWDLIPLFSWIFLKWKCRYCGVKIWIRYPLVELFFWIFFFIATFFLFPENINLNFISWENFFSNLFLFLQKNLDLISFLLVLFLVWNFLILAIYDILFLEIIDWIAIWLWFWVLWLAWLWEIFWFWNQLFLPNFQDWLIWFLIIYTFFYLQILIPGIIFFIREKIFSVKEKFFWVLKIFSSYFIFPIWMFFRLFFSEKFLDKFKIFSDEQKNSKWENYEIPAWIGGGDLRFALVMWFILWWQKSILALFVSYLVWWVYSIWFLIFEKFYTKKSWEKLSHEIPFLPFLTIWTFIVLVFWDKILEFYFRNFLYY